MKQKERINESTKKINFKKENSNEKINFKNIKTKNIVEHEDYEIGIQCDYDYYGDTRN